MNNLYHQNITSLEASDIIKNLFSYVDHEKPNVFAILDGARDKRIESLVLNSQHDHACLYTGRLSPALQQAAPYLVELQQHSDFTKQLIQKAWGKSWGIFIITPPDVTLTQVRTSFRKISRVRAPSTDGTPGKVMVFRYYDPRVLRIFLPTCERFELSQIFGPASCFVVEDENNKIMRFELEKLVEHAPSI